MEKEETNLPLYIDTDIDEQYATTAVSRDGVSEKHEAGSEAAEVQHGPNGDAPRAAPAPEELEYVTGFKLIIALTAVTAAVFIMLLDTSIVATVNEYCPNRLRFLLKLSQAIPRITSDFHSLEDIG